MPTPFADRTVAGRRLAEAVDDLPLARPLVLGVPRGGVPVAAEIAQHLGAPLDVVLVRKVGAPSQPEFALGAVGEGDVEVLDELTIRRLGVDRATLRAIIEDERTELRRRLERYRGGRPAALIADRDVLLVDDGVATGSSVSAALEVLRAWGAASVVLAVPVAPPSAVERLARRFDDVVSLYEPAHFGSVGRWFEDFSQVTDEEVVAALDRVDAAPRRL